MPYWTVPLGVLAIKLFQGKKVKRFTQIDRNKGTARDLGLVIILSLCLATLWHVALLDRCAFVAHILVAPHW